MTAFWATRSTSGAIGSTSSIGSSLSSGYWILVNNRARDRSKSNRHRNKNWVFFEHNFSWPLACTSIILKIDS